MKVELISADHLEPHHLAVWADLLRSQPDLDSPFFTPDFVRVVASVRQGVEVALLFDGNRLAGFFPFQRTRLNAADPVGVGFSEFHGVIASPSLRWSVPELLRGCRVVAWNYDHVPVSQSRFAAYHQRVGASPFMDLTEGYEAYCAERRQLGSSVVSRTTRKLRKLQREVGQVSLEFHDASDRSLQKLIAWKSAQHVRSGVVDVFQHDWVRQLLHRVQSTHTDAFSGVMSVLSAGGEPIAAHLGMKTAKVAHLWYPAYNPDFGKYSPGMILFLDMAREFAAQGVVRVDLGPTPQRYKQSLRSGDIDVAIGTADRYPLARMGRQVWLAGRKQIRASMLGRTAKLPGRWLFQMRQRQALR